MAINFDFGSLSEQQNVLEKTWEDFRHALERKEFTYKEIDKAKQYTFLKVYDDVFNQDFSISKETIKLRYFRDIKLGRGAVINPQELLDYDRFIPKKEYIKASNRFSPKGIEWLYLAVGSEREIHQCAQAECRAKKGDNFGFCHFKIESIGNNNKIVNLTFADNYSYKNIDKYLSKQINELNNKIKNKAFNTYKNVGIINYNLRRYREKLKNIYCIWLIYKYSKMLSEGIFTPLNETSNRDIMYAPFQTLAQYYISQGYSGILYKSTVAVGKNLVLFDKNMATPTGEIESYRIV